MRKLLLLVIVLFSTQIEAQIKATTENGKKVILFKDGTFKYLNSINKKVESRNILVEPNGIKSKMEHLNLYYKKGELFKTELEKDDLMTIINHINSKIEYLYYKNTDDKLIKAEFSLYMKEELFNKLGIYKLNHILRSTVNLIKINSKNKKLIIKQITVFDSDVSNENEWIVHVEYLINNVFEKMIKKQASVVFTINGEYKRINNF